MWICGINGSSLLQISTWLTRTSISSKVLSEVKYLFLVLSVIHPSGFCCLQVKAETPLLSSHVTTPLTSSCCRKASWECLPYTCAKSFSFRCVCVCCVVCVNLWQHWSSDALTRTLSPCLKIVKVKEKKGKKGRKRKKQRGNQGDRPLGRCFFPLVQRIRRISRRLQVKPDNVSGQRNNLQVAYTLLSVAFPCFLPPLSPSARQKISNAFFPSGRLCSEVLRDHCCGSPSSVFHF